jgi:D-alanyl-lipoteichoic acid acyltransferase DltB (MBOAT superfamily)
VAYYLCTPRFRWLWLVLASVAYYLSFIPIFFALIGVLVIGNYFGGRWLFRANERGNGKQALTTLVLLNIVVLAFFKYFNFFFPGLNVNLYFVDWFYRVDPINRMLIPLGLSYLVFTVISYLVEIKRKNIEPEHHFGYFSLYLLFFPRIAQGPIERPQKLLPQLREVHTFDYDLVTGGLKLMLWGYFKKLVVADRLAIYVNAVYNNSEQHNGTTLIVATIFFAFQIYADFSGYTDIALGSAMLFGIRLTDNFKRPYFATSVKEFWNRWHISFSTWLRDYLFLPLAFYFSKRMKKDKYLFIATEKWIYLFAIMITFAICGLWHGEGWNYLVWGLLFGGFLTFTNWTEKWDKNIRKRFQIRKTDRAYVFYNILLTFVLVSFTFIFFKSGSITQATGIIKSIFTSVGLPFYESPANLIYAVFGIMVLLAVDTKREFFNNKFSLFYNKYSAIRIGTIVSMVMIILLIGVFDGGQFIYFQY